MKTQLKAKIQKKNDVVIIIQGKKMICAFIESELILYYIGFSDFECITSFGSEAEEWLIKKITRFNSDIFLMLTTYGVYYE